MLRTFEQVTMTPHYRHTQTGWLIIGSIAAAAALVIPLVTVTAAPKGALLLAAVLVLAGFAFSTLTVEVDEREIRIRFTGGLIRRRVTLADLRSQRAVRNPWRYGWGIHMIPGGWIWNVSGLDAVELVLSDGHILRVGTDEPEALSRAIAQVAPGAGTTAAAPVASQGKRRGPWFAVVIAATVVVGVIAFVTPFYMQTRPPEVTVTPQHLSVRSPFYGDDYPIAEITAVSLETCPPRILARTNGFSGAGLLRGWFRVEGLGEGKLFLDLGTSPYLVVRMRQGFVILNFSEPEKTRAVYDEIERQRRLR
jgi:hypothetical protein